MPTASRTPPWTRRGLRPLGALLIILAAAALLRLQDFRSRPHLALTGDSHEYLRMARHLVVARGFAFETALPYAGRGPLYPTLLAAAAGDQRRGLRGIRIAHAALGLGTSLLSYGVAASLHSSPAGLAAAALVEFHPDLIAAEGVVGVEPLFAFCLLATAAVLALWVSRAAAGTAALLALVIGMTLTCRSTLAALPPLLWLLSLGWKPLRRPGSLAGRGWTRAKGDGL